MIRPAQVRPARTRRGRLSQPEGMQARSVTRSRLMLALALGLALICLGGARPAAARHTARHTTRHAARDSGAQSSRRALARVISRVHVGQVRFVTARGVYLDRGAAEGLANGQLVLLVRRSRVKRTKCIVELVSDHAALCRGTGAHVGDVFKLALPRQRGPILERAEPRPVVAEAVSQARAQTIAAAPHEKVPFAGQLSADLPQGVTLGASVTVWSGPDTQTGPRANEQIDVVLHRIRLGETDLRLDAALTAVRWQTRAADLRFRPATLTQFYVWDAEVSRREVNDLTVFSFGRIWPWHVPGVALLDGMQIGRRNLSGTVEGGAYGGLIPTATDLVPTTDIWAGGVYGALTQTGASRDLFQLFREEARVGFRHGPAVGLVTEAEVLTDASLGMFGANAGARFRYASATEHQPVWEHAYVGLRLRSTSTGGAWMQLRYVGAAPEQQPLLTNELPALRGGYHVVLNGSWFPRSWFQLAGFGSWHVDRDSGLHEAEAGLDLGDPRLFGDLGGLWLGVGSADGWLRSRTAYAQFLSRRLRAIQILARFTGSTTVFAAFPSTVNLAELGGYLQIEASLNARFRVRGRGSLRLPTVVQGLTPSGNNLSIVSGVDAIWLL